MSELGDLLTICNGRLTLTTGVPVTTSDVTAATTVYFTPYKGDHISLYDGEEWLFFQFAERSISLSGKTADTNYDVFIYDNAGTLTLELVAWTDATNRATALTTQNGVYVKSGDATRRYIGTIRTTATIGQCEESEAKRFCWNYYNQVERSLFVFDDASHSYTVTAWRYWNNDSSMKVEMVIGIQQGRTKTAWHAWIYNPGGSEATSIGLDTSTSEYVDASATRYGLASWHAMSTSCDVDISIGYHYVALIEYRYGGTGNFLGGKLFVVVPG